MLSRVNRISSVALVINVGLAVVLVAIVERMAVTAFGVNGVVAGGVPSVPVEPSERSDPPPRTSRKSRTPVRLAALTSTVRDAALVQRGELARRAFGTETTGRPIVQRTRSTKTWTFGTAALPPPKGNTAVPDVALFLARAVGTRWQVAFAGTADFTRLLRSAPAAVMPSAERQLLARYNATAVPSSAGLMLPWTQGQPWSLVADRYGVGFAGGDGKVLAAGNGRLYRFCATSDGGGLILLVHPNGMATEYYQVGGQPRPSGSAVKRGDVLGRIGTDRPCGGGSTEPQVRFGLRHADRPVSIAGKTLGGWTFHEGTDLDRFVAVRGDQQVLPGEDVVNHGIPAARDLPDPDLPDVPELPDPPGGDRPGLPTPPSLPNPANTPRSANKT
jgi:hypothetical protein